MKSILVPIDISYLSKCSLEMALQLSELSGAELEIIAIVKDKELVEDHNTLKQIEAVVVNEKTSRAKHRVDELRQFHEELDIDIKVLFGEPVEVLSQEAERTNADLIVMGGDRFSDANTNAKELLHNSNTPILILKCRLDQLEKFKDIVLLADEKPFSEVFVKAFIEFTSLFPEMTVHIAYQDQMNFELVEANEEAIKKGFSEQPNLKDVTSVFIDGNQPIQSIYNYSKKFGSVFIATHIGELGFWGRLFSNDKEAALIMNSEYPIWTFKN